MTDTTKVKDSCGAATIELFVQAEGRRHITIVQVALTARVQELVEAAARQGISPVHGTGPVLVSLEESCEPAQSDSLLADVGIGHKSRVHIHRCQRVEVTVFFNGRTISRQFPASATIGKVTEWAVGKKGFAFEDDDAVEHVLQLSQSTERPDEDEHVGTLVSAATCTVSFDLVPKQRVEG